MRNLKRALSLALASVMLLGMMVVGTSASYADVSSKNNLEAIEVLQKVGIMTGDDKGNFNPDQKVTRNEMAVIMCNLLDYTVASYKGTSKFTDVPAWAEPYVAACYTNGIIAGYSSTYFGGSDSVTTGQAALMLMKALGYFQYASDFGEDWLVATTSQGSKINLFDSIDNGAREALTRNEVAQLVLNALEATMVDYSGNGGTTIKGDGFEITTGKATYDNRTSNDKKYSKIDATKENGKYTIELGEDLFGGDLKKTAGETDKLGRPGTMWSYKGEEIGTYGDTADRVFVLTDTYTIGDAKDNYDSLLAVLQDEDFMDSTKVKYAVDADTKKDDVTVAVNGTETKKIYKDDVDSTIKDALVNKAEGGTIVELYLADNDDKVIENVVILNYSMAQIDKVDTKISKSDKDDGATCKIKLKDGKGSYNDNDITGFNASTFVKDAYVLYIKDAEDLNKKLADAQIAAEVEGEVTALKGSNKATINGTTYKYITNVDAHGAKVVKIDVEDEGTFYLNVAGQIAAVDTSSKSKDYIYIYAIDHDNKMNSDGVKTDVYTAYYVGTDGVKGSAEVDDIDKLAVALLGKDKTVADFVFVAADGKPVNTKGVIAYSLNSDKELVVEKAKDTINNAAGKMTFKKDKASGADSDTQFIFCYTDGSKQKVSTAVGYKNVKVENQISYTVKDGNDILYVFVNAKNGSVANDDNLAVVVSTTKTTSKDGDDTIYSYDVVVDGKETTLSFKRSNAPADKDIVKGAVIPYAMDGNYATVKDVDTKVYTATAKEATKDYITVAENGQDVQYNLSDAKAIYTINVEYKKDGKTVDTVYVTEGADIDAKDDVKYTVDGDKLDVLFVYDYVK